MQTPGGDTDNEPTSSFTDFCALLLLIIGAILWDVVTTLLERL